MKTTLILFISSLFMGLSHFDTKSDALLGEWINEKKDARVLIYKIGNKYNGKVTWGEGDESKDVKNPDPKLRNREIVGTNILLGFVYSGDNVWSDGTIYDPREGKTYSCKITMKNNNLISIRGYVGVSLFGRSEEWTRFNSK